MKSNQYSVLFYKMLSTLDFELVEHENGEYSLIDLQGANLGNIEGDTFETASEIADRLELYISDYFLNDDEWGNYYSCEQALRKNPNHPCACFLDLIANHISEVDLHEVELETRQSFDLEATKKALNEMIAEKEMIYKDWAKREKENNSTLEEIKSEIYGLKRALALLP